MQPLFCFLKSRPLGNLLETVWSAHEELEPVAVATPEQVADLAGAGLDVLGSLHQELTMLTVEARADDSYKRDHRRRRLKLAQIIDYHCYHNTDATLEITARTAILLVATAGFFLTLV